MNISRDIKHVFTPKSDSAALKPVKNTILSSSCVHFNGCEPTPQMENGLVRTVSGIPQDRPYGNKTSQILAEML